MTIATDALARALEAATDLDGRTLRAICDARPTLVVVTRHAGCTFCREALKDLEGQRAAIERAGLAISIVSMSAPDALADLAARYDLPGAHWISDPERVLYEALELERGSLAQLFGPKMWWRGIVALAGGHGIGRVDGDGAQMPGSFVIREGRVLRAHRHRTAGERVDHAAFACERPE